jgi:4-carboxymuconolactone decarboxylase
MIHNISLRELQMKALLKDPLFKKGLAVRKEVLGAEDVERRLADADEYTLGFEEITTKAAWGIIWSRPGISRKVRSFINLGVLTALRQPEELRVHIRVALRNGLTRKEIGEAILHCSVYCGIPRAADARRVMSAVFAALDAQGKPGSTPKYRGRRN